MKKGKRQELYIKYDKKCNCCQIEFEFKQIHIDHIKPLASGGNNDDINLQILCKECHFEKSKDEQQNQEYVRTSETASSYSSQTFDVINSLSASVFSFHESLICNNKNNKRLFKIDLKKSRKNAMYYSSFDYPLFTVMDQVEAYKKNMSINRPGLYYVESDLYYPIRGNGWYSNAMVSFLINKI